MFKAHITQISREKNLQVCNVWRKPSDAQPIETSDSSISTGDPRPIDIHVVTWSQVIGHVRSGSRSSACGGTRAVQRAEPDVVDLRQSLNNNNNNNNNNNWIYIAPQGRNFKGTSRHASMIKWNKPFTLIKTPILGKIYMTTFSPFNRFKFLIKKRSVLTGMFIRPRPMQGRGH